MLLKDHLLRSSLELAEFISRNVAQCLKSEIRDARTCNVSISDTRGALPTQKLCSAVDAAGAAEGAALRDAALGKTPLGALCCAEVDTAPVRARAAKRLFPSSKSRLAACARSRLRPYAATSAASHASRNAAAKCSAEQSGLRSSASNSLRSGGKRMREHHACTGCKNIM